MKLGSLFFLDYRGEKKKTYVGIFKNGFLETTNVYNECRVGLEYLKNKSCCYANPSIDV